MLENRWSLTANPQGGANFTSPCTTYTVLHRQLMPDIQTYPVNKIKSVCTHGSHVSPTALCPLGHATKRNTII